MKTEQLTQLAREYSELGQKIKRLEELRRQRKKKILSELKRRRVKTYDDDSIRITSVEPSTIVYNAEALRELLGPRMFAKVCDHIPSGDKIAKAVQSGKIDMESLEAVSEKVDRSPYPNVTIKG